MDRPTRVVGRRVVAWVIDVVIGYAVYVALVVALGESFETFDSGFQIETVDDTTFVQLGSTGYALEGGDFGIVALIAVGWWLLNLVLLTGLIGASIGKLVAGVRVVRPDGATCGVGRAFVRWILWVVDAFPYIAPVVGFVTALATEGNRRVGDMAAGTYVVRASAAGRAVMTAPAAQAVQATAGAYAATAASDAQWDPVRQAWIRWDGAAWTQHDPSVPGGWRPIS